MCSAEAAREFVRVLETVEMGRMQLAEALDRVRSLPGFPAGWQPGQPVRMRIAPLKPKTIIEVRG